MRKDKKWWLPPLSYSYIGPRQARRSTGCNERCSVRRQNLVDLKLPELRETLAHQVVLMLITVMHLLAERQGL